MSGGSFALVIPKSWLRQQAERLKVKVVEVFDLFIYDKYIEIRPTKQKMEIHNDTRKDLTIAFGSNPNDTIVGTLKAGATDDLPVEDARFFNVLSIEEQKMEVAKEEITTRQISLTLTEKEAETILAELRRINLSPTLDEELGRLKRLLHKVFKQNMAEKQEPILDPKIAAHFAKIVGRITDLEVRFKKLTDVLYNYLEAGSSISLAAVKANLKSV